MTDQPLSKIFIKGELSKRFFDNSATAVGLVNSFLTITFLSVFQFGLYQLILAFIAIVDGFTVKNLDQPISTEMRHYFASGEKDKAKRIFMEMSAWRIGFALLAGFAIFFGSEIIAGWYGNEIGLLIKLASPLLLFFALHSLESLFFTSIIAFPHWSLPAIREIAKLGIIGALIFFGNFNIVGIVAAHVAAEAIAVLFFGAIFFFKKFSEIFSGVKVKAEYLILNFVKTHGKWIFLQFGFSRITKNTMPWFIKLFINTEAVAFYSLAVNLVSFIEGFMPIGGISPIFLMKMNGKSDLIFLFKRSVKYVFWLGIIFLVVGFFAVPPLILLIFPKYAPALPLFKIMLLALPIFGVYKVLKSLISTLREYKLLTMRILRESLVIPISAVIFLPLFGLIGAGFVYIAIYWERVLMFYRELIKKHPDYRMKLKTLFFWDQDDRSLAIKTASQFLDPIKAFFRRI